MLKKKAKALAVKNGGRPYDHVTIEEGNAVEFSTPTFQNEYLSLQYFNPAQAQKYYRSSDALISKVITSLVHYNDYGCDDRYLADMVSFLEEGIKEAAALVYRHKKGYQKFDAKPGYISGILQGKIASAFIRAYIGTEDEKYKIAAKQSLRACLIHKDKNGPYRTLSEKNSWVEEYPSPTPSLVLNGHIFTLIALAEYLTIEKDAELSKLYNRCLNTTLYLLPSYRKDDEVLYSLYHWDLCNIHYIGIMHYQMDHLYKLTGVSEFSEWAAFLKQKCKWDIFRKLMG